MKDKAIYLAPIVVATAIKMLETLAPERHLQETARKNSAATLGCFTLISGVLARSLPHAGQTFSFNMDGTLLIFLRTEDATPVNSLPDDWALSHKTISSLLWQAIRHPKMLTMAKTIIDRLKMDARFAGKGDLVTVSASVLASFVLLDKYRNGNRNILTAGFIGNKNTEMKTGAFIASVHDEVHGNIADQVTFDFRTKQMPLSVLRRKVNEIRIPSLYPEFDKIGDEVVVLLRKP